MRSASGDVEGMLEEHQRDDRRITVPEFSVNLSHAGHYAREAESIPVGPIYHRRTHRMRASLRRLSRANVSVHQRRPP